MSKRPLWVLVGALLVVAGALLAAIQLEPGAAAGRLLRPPAMTACNSPLATAAPALALGGRWNIVDRLDTNGVMLGRTLVVGRGSATIATTELPVESSVSGPVHGLAVVVSDDGTRSRIRLVSIERGCARTIDESADVIRTAILNPTDGSVLAHVVDRASRADRGTFRIATGAGSPTWTLVVPPLDDEVAGSIWGTNLALAPDGRQLAVQSCVDERCVTRIVNLALPGEPPSVVRGTQQGTLLGFADGQLVTWAACPGLPCPVLAWDLSAGSQRVLIDGAGAAALTADGQRLVATQSDGRRVVALLINPRTGNALRLKALPAGQLPLAPGPNATVGLEVASDEIVIGSAGTDARAFRPDTAVEVLP